MVPEKEDSQSTLPAEQSNVADQDDSSYIFDITNGHLHTLSGNIEIPTSVRHLDLTANRLADIEECVLELEHLETLSFRQNLLRDAGRLSQLKNAENLKSLELRDNQLEELPDMSRFGKLEYLELSYNVLRNIGGLDAMRKDDHPLKELYLANNKIKVIEGLESFQGHLEQLELGSNRIKSMHGIESLRHLQSLWLGSNRIERIDIDMSCFRYTLKQISLQSNRLTSMDGLEECEALEEIYVSDNGITELCRLDSLKNLKVLDVSRNQLRGLDGVGTLPLLTDLWANNNLIENLEQVEIELQGLADSLQVLYLNNNPFLEGQVRTSYKLRMTHILPNLEQLDDVLVQHHHV
jgi:protein phosphatase 1 regulatory subunit 7